MRILFPVALLLLLASWLPAYAAMDYDNVEYAKDAVALIVVNIAGADFIITGSGFAISDDGYVVTNAHVVDGHDVGENGEPIEWPVESIQVVFYSGTPDQVVYDAEVLALGGSDIPVDEAGFSDVAYYDLALLGIEPAEELAYFEISAASELYETQQVYAAGFPLGLEMATRDDLPEISLRTGSVSSLRHNSDDDICIIEHTASLEHGNSGGPLISADGDVVGVNTWTYGDNINRAISAEMLARFLDEVAELQLEDVVEEE